MKCVDVETKEQKLFSAHEAPVLSVALHPDEQLIVSGIVINSCKLLRYSDACFIHVCQCVELSLHSAIVPVYAFYLTLQLYFLPSVL